LVVVVVLFMPTLLVFLAALVAAVREYITQLRHMLVVREPVVKGMQAVLVLTLVAVAAAVRAQ
jgi:hypothetical protein